MLLVCIGIFIMVYFFLRMYSRHGHEFAVPEIVGKNIEDIASIPESQNLEYVIIDSIFVANSEGGVILTQDPVAHEKVKEGRKVYITISAYSPEKVIVPEVMDMTVRRAVSELEGAGLQGGKLTFIENDYKNAILGQSYRGKPIHEKTEVPKGSMIDLTVGLGALPNEAVTLAPFVLGKTPEDARRSILSASMNVGKEHYETDMDIRYARVYKQYPDYNGVTRLPLGATVELWYRSENKTDFKKLVREFKVDTSNAQPETESNWDLEW